MTEIEREAEARAKAAKILETSGVGKLLDMGPWEDLIDSISEALLSASRPPAGFVRDEHGVDRRVLGTLPVTADGCVVGVRDEYDEAGEVVCTTCGQMHDPKDIHLWHPDFDDPGHLCSDFQFVGFTDRPTIQFYSTREGAEAAKAARTAAEAAAGKERG